MADEYQRRAEEAEAAARRAVSDEERETYEKVAALWRELAQRRAAKKGEPKP